MRWVLTMLGVLWAAGASAQTTTAEPLSIRLAGDVTAESYRFREAAACGDTLVFQWTYQSTSYLCGSMQLWATEGDCGDEPATGDKRYAPVLGTTVQTTGSDTFNVVPGELPGFAAGTSTCGAANVSKPHRLCASVRYTSYQCVSTDPFLTAGAGFELTYDSVPPSPPIITAQVALDRAAKLSFTVDADVYDLIAEVRVKSDGGVAFGAAVASVSETEDAVKVTQLVNGTTYEFRLRAQDKAGNVSEPSAIVEVTPIRTVGFWGVFREQGGTEQGGCAAAGGAPTLALALLALRRLFRRRSTL